MWLPVLQSGKGPEVFPMSVMTRHLFCAQPLSKPMLGYCQLDPWEQASMKF